MAKNQDGPSVAKKRKVTPGKAGAAGNFGGEGRDGRDIGGNGMARPMQSLSMLAPMFPLSAASFQNPQNSKSKPTRSTNNASLSSLNAVAGSSSLKSSTKDGKSNDHVIVVDSDSDAEQRLKPAQKSTTKAFGKGKQSQSVPPPSSSPIVDLDLEEHQEGHDQEDSESSHTHQMWTDLFTPSTIEELATSKTRINPLRAWLTESIHGVREDQFLSSTGTNNNTMRPFSETQIHALKRMRRLLILSGPAGVGKSTSLRVVAESMGLEIVEWEDGADGGGGGVMGGGESSLSRFLTFLSRTSYTPLPLQTNTDLHKSTSQTSIKPSPSRPRLLLLPQLPTLSQPHLRQSFQSALLTFLATYDDSTISPGSQNNPPLVIIIPDEGLSGSAEESWMAGGKGKGKGEGWGVREIIGEALFHPNACWISFPSVAPTFMTKALKRIMNLSISYPTIANSIRSSPSDEILRAISQTANGDLRSAINSLQFLCMSGRFPGKGGTGDGLKGGKGTGKDEKGGKKTGKGSRGGKGALVTSDKRLLEMLNSISRREQSLGLFHALGKVLYNKRRGDPDDEELDVPLEETDTLPDHLAGFKRRPYKNDFDTLLGTVPVDNATFTLWLHQNLPQYCEDVDQMFAAMEDIGTSDMMKTDTDLWATNVQSIAYAFHISVRGCVMALPSPVPRNNQKVFKPAFFNFLRQAKESRSTMMELAATTSVVSTATNQGEESPLHVEQNMNVWSTELMPFYRQMKRCNPDDPKLANIDGFALIPDNPTVQFDHMSQQRLAVLTEGDDDAMTGEGDLMYEEAVDMAGSSSADKPTMVEMQIGEEQNEIGIGEMKEEVTWLMDDDIED